MIKSMTGFGRGQYRKDGIYVLVEIKAVNHRYCDVYVKMPRKIISLEDRIRETIVKKVSRGRIEVFVTFEDLSGQLKKVLLDEGLARGYINAVNILKEKFDLKDDISLSMISDFPDMFKTEKIDEDDEKNWIYIKNALDKALYALNSMRENEGCKLKESLTAMTFNIEEMLNKIEERAPCIVEEYAQKLRKRIEEMLGRTNMDENRLAEEIALFADRCSIDEELVRLKSHIVQIRETLDMNKPVGRKLDFIIQEINREINTIGSKANDLLVTGEVVDLKSEIEKMREQVQNIE
jgi:uncharacterized protein (TIGR00255 family)